MGLCSGFGLGLRYNVMILGQFVDLEDFGSSQRAGAVVGVYFLKT